MKKVLPVALIVSSCLLAPQTFAGSLLFDARIDYNSTTYNDEAGQPDFSKFYMKTGRLDYKGQIDDQFSYRARIAFNKNPAPSLRDSVGPAVEYAYIRDKTSDLFTLSAGKDNTETSGFEGAASGADLYLQSTAYSHSGPGGELQGRTVGSTDIYYMTGVKGIFHFYDQNIYVTITNPDTDHTQNGVLDQNTSLYGLAWLGSFSDKLISVRASYHYMEGPAGDDKNDFIATGVLLNFEPVEGSVDILSNSFKEGLSGDTDRVSSIIAKVGFKFWEHWTPRLELSASQEKREITVAETNKFLGTSAIIEYKPNKDNEFRYHAAIIYTEESPETGDNKTKTEIIVGTRLLADFLK